MLEFMRFYLRMSILYRPLWLLPVTVLAVFIGMLVQLWDVNMYGDVFLSFILLTFFLVLHEWKIYRYVRKAFICFNQGVAVQGTIVKRLKYQNLFWTLAGPDIIYKFETQDGRVVTARAPKWMHCYSTLLKPGKTVTIYYLDYNPRKSMIFPSWIS